ncbi:MAG: LysR family transcriptional regulator [Pseudorhodobacter sp.]
MPDSWDDYRFMLYLYRHRTMAAAARSLGTSAATVSRRIERARDIFGVPAFSKKGETWMLNPELEPAMEVISQFAEAIRAQKNNLGAGPARSVTALSVGCPPFIASCILLPNMTVEGGLPENIDLTLSSRFLDQGLGDCDIVLRQGLPDSGRLIARRAGAMTFRLYQPVGAEASRRWVGLTRDQDSFGPMRRVAEVFNSVPAMRVSQFDHLRDLILSTGLPGPLPDVMARRDPRLELAQPLAEESAEFWLAFHETRSGDRALRATVDWIISCFARNERLN